MNNKIIIVVIVGLVVLVSGCIQSDSSQINGVSSSINTHIKNGDSDFNNAVYDTNDYEYIQAISYCDNATSEYNMALSSAQQASSYANSSNDPVVVNYMNLVMSEINAKLNATSELLIAIQDLEQNNTINANIHIGNANKYMDNATVFNTKRTVIIQQNPTKFK